MIRAAIAIQIVSLQDGATVRFARDEALLARFRARFPAARWGAGNAVWHIPGKLAAARAETWAAEEYDYLHSLENRLRDIEWERSSPFCSEHKLRAGLDRYPNVNRSGSAVLAIPGQPAGPAPMPPGAPDLARQAIKRIAGQIAALELFGFLRPPPIFVQYYWPPDMVATLIGQEPPPRLDVWVDSRLTRSGTTTISIVWTWGVLWETGRGDKTVGWHPSSHYFGIETWGPALWDALNPGKRPPGWRYP